MSILAWIVLGGLAGFIASMLTETNRSVLGDIILGVLGAIIGGWLVSLFTGQGVTGFNLPSLLVAVVVSVVLILISRAFRGNGVRV